MKMKRLLCLTLLALAIAAHAANTFLALDETGALIGPTASEVRLSLSLVPGTHIQVWDADLDTWATVTSSANGRSLVSAADYSAMRTLLGLVINTDVLAPNGSGASLTGVQPSDAALTALAGGSDFVQFAGPNTTTKVFTLPNAAASILTDNAAVTVAQGGTALTSLTQYGVLYAPTTSSLAGLTGTAGTFLKFNGAGIPTASSVDLASSNVSGLLPVASGGTGIGALGTGVVTGLGSATNATTGFVTANGLSGGTLSPNFASGTVANGLSVGGTAYSYGAPSATGAFAILNPATTYTITSGATGRVQANYFGVPTISNASGAITDAFGTVMAGPAAVTGGGSITRAHTLGVIDSTSASSSTTGGLVVATAFGTAATSVGIGGGNINAGGSGTFGSSVNATYFRNSGFIDYMSNGTKIAYITYNGGTDLTALQLGGTTAGMRLTMASDGNVTLTNAAGTASTGNLTVNKLTVGGGFRMAYVAKAADYTMVNTTDCIVGVTSTAAARVITLPSAVTAGAGAICEVKDESGGAATNNITVKSTAGTIDGVAAATGIPITTNYGVLRVYSNGTNWFTR